MGKPGVMPTFWLSVEKSVRLTTFRRLFYFNPTLIFIKGLTPKYGGQFKPAAYGLGFRLFQIKAVKLDQSFLEFLFFGSPQISF
jgi:hypothetical protein